MSIADGQVVLQRDIDGAVSMDFANSISRMGARAHPPAMQALCPPIRLRLAQVCIECALLLHMTACVRGARAADAWPAVEWCTVTRARPVFSTHTLCCGCHLGLHPDSGCLSPVCCRVAMSLNVSAGRR